RGGPVRVEHDDGVVVGGLEDLAAQPAQSLDERVVAAVVELQPGLEREHDARGVGEQARSGYFSHGAVTVFLRSQTKSKLQSPPSRPRRDGGGRPNGARRPRTKKQLTQTVPATSEALTRSARSGEPVATTAASPNRVPLASSTASSSVSKVCRVSTGPK